LTNLDGGDTFAEITAKNKPEVALGTSKLTWISDSERRIGAAYDIEKSSAQPHKGLEKA